MCEGLRRGLRTQARVSLRAGTSQGGAAFGKTPHQGSWAEGEARVEGSATGQATKQRAESPSRRLI